MSTRFILRTTLLWHIHKARRMFHLLQGAIADRSPTGARRTGGARWG